MAGVVARPSVVARPMIRAVIQVLVAEEAAPAFFADAVPRFGAGSVDAARVAFALVAQLAHPARMTSETEEMNVLHAPSGMR